MSTTIPSAPLGRVAQPRARRDSGITAVPLAIIEVMLALGTTLPALRLVRPLVIPAANGVQRSGFNRLMPRLLALIIGCTITAIQLGVTNALSLCVGPG